MTIVYLGLGSNLGDRSRQLAEARRLLATAKAIERELGRTPTFRWGPRAIDVDLLLFGDATVREPDLVIPHPGLRRPFVLVGLRELRPDLAAGLDPSDPPPGSDPAPGAGGPGAGW